MDSQQKSQLNELSVKLDARMKAEILKLVTADSGLFVGIPYEFGAKASSLEEKPRALDCSGLTKLVYDRVGIRVNLPAFITLPPGSQQQYNLTVPVMNQNSVPGDLAFFGRNADATKIYHVGILFDEKTIIEARDFDPVAKFETGKVILRDRLKWEGYANFRGYRRHPYLV